MCQTFLEGIFLPPKGIVNDHMALQCKLNLFQFSEHFWTHTRHSTRHWKQYTDLDKKLYLLFSGSQSSKDDTLKSNLGQSMWLVRKG